MHCGMNLVRFPIHHQDTTPQRPRGDFCATLIVNITEQSACSTISTLLPILYSHISLDITDPTP